MACIHDFWTSLQVFPAGTVDLFLPTCLLQVAVTMEDYATDGRGLGPLSPRLQTGS